MTRSLGLCRPTHRREIKGGIISKAPLRKKSQEHRWKWRDEYDLYIKVVLNYTSISSKRSWRSSLAPWKMLKTFKAEQPWKYSCYKDLIAFTVLPMLIDSLGPVITQHVIHPFLSLILSLCKDSILINALPFSSLFLSLPKLYSLLFLLSHTQRTQKTNYNTAEPIWEQQASHSAGEGGWNAFHQTSKLQHVKPRPIACPVQHLDHSSAMSVDLIIRGTLL